eukprot:1609178-Amphidinium_carterae.1
MAPEDHQQLKLSWLWQTRHSMTLIRGTLDTTEGYFFKVQSTESTTRSPRDWIEFPKNIKNISWPTEPPPTLHSHGHRK